MSKLRGDGEGEGFFVVFFVFADCACIFSSVTGINYNGLEFETVCTPERNEPGEQTEEYADCVFQK